MDKQILIKNLKPSLWQCQVQFREAEIVAGPSTLGILDTSSVKMTIIFQKSAYVFPNETSTLSTEDRILINKSSNDILFVIKQIIHRSFCSEMN